MSSEFDLDAILSEFGGGSSSQEPEESAPQAEPALWEEPAPVRREEIQPEEGFVLGEDSSQPGSRPEEEEEEPAPKPRPRPRRRSLYEDETYSPEEDERRRELTRRVARGLLSFVLSLLALLCLGWALQNIHPSTGSPAPVQRKQNLNVAGTLDPQATAPVSTPAPTAEPDSANGETPEETGEPEATPAPEKIHYTIPEDALAGPTPSADGFHTVSLENVSEVMDVIERAREDGLLGEDEKTVFNQDIDFYWDSNVEYYYDETILTICWKEVVDGNTCSLVETKIADASQFRRKLAGDAFGSPNQYYATELARNTNSVVAMNADYYLFRDFGIVVYNRELYRFNTATYTGMYKKYNCVETCFVNSEGDFLFNTLGEESSAEAVKQFIADNDILFSFSFGPVLVQNGETRTIDWYPVGEIEKGYSRAGIGQVDKLHYLYMSVNHEGVEARWTVNTFARHFGEKGVMNAYCLDGGQTGEIVFQGRPFNHVDFNAERLVSDIIYFATAIPEEVSP